MPGIPGCFLRLRKIATRISALLVVPLMMATASAGTPAINTTDDNVAINGYDTVAYFTDGKATKGSAQYEVVWQDARWRFASAEHLRLFEADPSHYAPQFGGWCAVGVAVGEFYEVDAETWSIVDGKLYLNYSREVKDEWKDSQKEKIAAAERVWAAQTKSQ